LYHRTPSSVQVPTLRRHLLVVTLWQLGRTAEVTWLSKPVPSSPLLRVRTKYGVLQSTTVTPGTPYSRPSRYYPARLLPSCSVESVLVLRTCTPHSNRYCATTITTTRSTTYSQYTTVNHHPTEILLINNVYSIGTLYSSVPTQSAILLYPQTFILDYRSPTSYKPHS
jgi:hypothetical protein